MPMPDMIQFTISLSCPQGRLHHLRGRHGAGDGRQVHQVQGDALLQDQGLGQGPARPQSGQTGAWVRSLYSGGQAGGMKELFEISAANRSIGEVVLC